MKRFKLNPYELYAIGEALRYWSENAAFTEESKRGSAELSDMFMNASSGSVTMEKWISERFKSKS